MPAPQIKRVAAPLREQVLDLLRADILASEFEPGQRLVEARLCARYEVSRTVIREVLRQLESEGLVSIVPNHGPVVAELTPADAKALFEVRAALEGLAGALFAQRATAKQRKRLGDALQEVRKSVKREDLAARLAIKDDFYDALIDGADNEVIRTTLRGIHARVQMLRGLSMQAKGRGEQVLRELGEITDAAATRRDPEAARKACEQHVHSASEVALRELENRTRAAEDGVS
jgi:DNA-binding GntR family transcriptional regulator